MRGLIFTVAAIVILLFAIKTVGMRRVIFTVAIIAIVLFAISYRTSLSWRYKPAPDYCKKEKRRIPDREKIERVLLFANESQYYYSHHLKAFENSFAKINPRADQLTMVRACLGRYPNCCKVIDPVFVREKDWTSEYEYIATKDGYTKDVMIHQRYPFGEIRNSEKLPYNPNHQLDFMFFNCGKIKEVNRS